MSSTWWRALRRAPTRTPAERRSRPPAPPAELSVASKSQYQPPPANEYAAARKHMVQSQLAARGIGDPATLAAMALVPREAFVAPQQRARAYLDGAQSIGRGQTISQPYMVARMTESLGFADLDWPWLGRAPAFLDVGTGSGYQAAVLAQLGARVTSIERDASLADSARTRLRNLGYTVEVVTGDGTVGYPTNAPYSGIVVGAGRAHGLSLRLSIPRAAARGQRSGSRLPQQTPECPITGPTICTRTSPGTPRGGQAV